MKSAHQNTSVTISQPAGVFNSSKYKSWINRYQLLGVAASYVSNTTQFMRNNDDNNDDDNDNDDNNNNNNNNNNNSNNENINN